MAKKVSYSNQVVSQLLRSVAAAYTLRNENRFKVVAYEKAADSVEHLNRELYDIWQDEKLDTIPGLGPSIRSSLNELFTTGKSKHFDEVVGTIPQPVFELMKVPSIGPKKAFKLVKDLKLDTSKHIFEDIRSAAKKGVIATLPTFGEKSQQELIESIERYKADKQKEYRMPLPYAHKMALNVLEYLKKHPSVIRADALGSMRRMSATIGDIDIAVAIKGNNIKEILEYFLTYPNKVDIDNAGDTKASIIVPPNIRVDLRVQDIDNYGSMLQYFTGNKTHNIKLREHAIKKGYSLSENGIKTVKTGEVTSFKEEKLFYNFLGYQYIPPEIREGTNELEVAVKQKVPDLIEITDIKGDLHTHSSYDLKPSHDFGANTYLELAQNADKLGYEYIGFSDHNPKISNTTKRETIEIMKKRKFFIDKTMKKSLTKYFISLETDILPSGELALPKEAIEYVDYLIVSVHSSFSMRKEDM